MTQLLFPHDSMRAVQEELVATVREVLQNRKHLVVHAPTGLGKTAATLAPALEHALENDLTVFFLTSKHTQHLIAIETLKQMRTKHHTDIPAVDIIGKKWMCLQEGVHRLYAHDFAEYCKNLREENTCEFYTNLKKGNQFTVQARKLLEETKKLPPLHTEELMAQAKQEGVCPYYFTEHLAAGARVIVTDYYYLFHPNIRQIFLDRTNKALEKSILIVDEGHNLPGRVRDLMTVRLTSSMIERAMKEAKKFRYEGVLEQLQQLQKILADYAEEVKETREKTVRRGDFQEKVEAIGDYQQVMEDYASFGEEVQLLQKQSSLTGIARFLEAWLGQEEGFARIFSIDETRKMLSLSYRCLDPSLITKPVIEGSYATLLMSGTLTPTGMYRDLLGFPENTLEKEFPSPFKEENRLSLIVPETTTKFTMRNTAQFKEIAKITASMVNLIPGNALLFFPSYALRNQIYDFFEKWCKKPCMLEQQHYSKEEKSKMLETFKAHSTTGAVLLGTTAGNFAEGIDLPGDLLKAVIVVGLPLHQPDLETKALIKYFDRKYGRGWDYGYIFPAFTKCLQSAGRCIRSETDRGVIAFVDVRYAWPMYRRCFPPDDGIKISQDWEREIGEFFDTVPH